MHSPVANYISSVDVSVRNAYFTTDHAAAIVEPCSGYRSCMPKTFS